MVILPLSSPGDPGLVTGLVTTFTKDNARCIVSHKLISLLWLPFRRFNSASFPGQVLWVRAIKCTLGVWRMVSIRREMYGGGAVLEKEAGQHVRRDVAWGTGLGEGAVYLRPVERDDEDDEGRIDSLRDSAR